MLLGSSYRAADVIIRIDDYILNDFFCRWELESGNLDAALRRFRATDRKGLGPGIEVEVARAYVFAGRRSEIPDLLSKINHRWVHYISAYGHLKSGAAIRHLVSEGDAKAAVNEALHIENPDRRMIALVIIAEALSGVPGLPNEELPPVPVYQNRTLRPH
jgi:hypothetical protein